VSPAPPATGLRVAAVQEAAEAGDVVANVATAAQRIREAADGGTRLVVLPELYLCGYDVATVLAEPDCTLDVARLGDDPRLDPLREATRGTGVVALVGASVRHDDGRRTISLLRSADGAVDHAYAKQHLVDDEPEAFVAGDVPVVVEVDGWHLGLGVCYDGCFPEQARAYADAGAHAYVLGMAYAVGSEHRRDVYYRARAVDNGMYVVAAGLVGECGAARCSGGSTVIDPEARVLASVADGETGLAVGVLEPDTLDRVRASQRMHAHHRRDLGRVVHR